MMISPASQGEGEELKKRMQAEGFAAGRQEGLAKGMEEKSREFVEKGAEVYQQA